MLIEDWDERGNLVWMSPGGAFRNWHHTVWILEHLEMLIEGIYPSRPVETGYEDMGIVQRSIRRSAPFETACEIAAEAEMRLSRVGLDRYLLQNHYISGKTIPFLAHELNIEEEEIRRRLRRAVNYISSGACGRWLLCADCRQADSCPRRSQREARSGITYDEWTAHRRKKTGLSKKTKG